jgi:hypothetical protein
MKHILGLGAAAIVALSMFGAASADENKRVKIINETNHKIVQFYASRVGTNDWEEDILDVDVLDPGQSVTINFGGSDFCLYDFKAVFSDGETMIRNRINVCEMTVYRYMEE